jgi:mannosyltransferase OCH1-like enzyme
LPEDATAVFFQEEFGTIGNNFIAIVPGHPVIKTALELGAEALNRGDRDLIWLSTGPGLLTRALVRAWTEFPQRQSLKGIVILDRGILRRAVGPHCAAAYKKTAQHWSRSAFSIRSTTKISQPLTKNNEPADSI